MTDATDAIADPLTFEIDIEATPDTVFDFFVDEAKLCRWLASSATLDPRPGGVCLQLHEAEDTSQPPYRMQGTFLEVDRPNRVVFTWGFDDARVDLEPGATVVEVTLEARGEATRVHLLHRGLPVSEVREHTSGWTEMLQRLGRAVEADR
jgi:uncharacterized protein YndB with AHSA1/START domain